MAKTLLIRHAEAVERAGLSDDARWLTARGRGVARRLGERLRKAGVVPDAIVTSPLVRAVQTAELVAQGLGGELVVAVVPELAPLAAVRAAAQALLPLGELVMAVGHEPNMTALAAWLTSGSGPAGFRKGQAVLCEDGRVLRSFDPE